MTLSLGRMTLLGVTMGLLVGVLEAVAVVLLILTVPGGLSWRTANGAEILFTAPPVNAVVFGILAIVVWLGSLVSKRVRWDVVFVTIGGLLAGYLGATMPGPLLTWWAVLMFSIGCAALARQIYLARHDWIARNLGRIALGLAVLSLLAVPAVLGHRRWRERRALAALPAAPEGRPNLLLLVIDTQRADHLGLYGYHRPTSPELDRIGAQGLVYQRGTASSSWTLPSHATMLTGRLPHEHQAGIMRRPFLDEKWPTVAEALSAGGYATAGFVANTFWVGRRTGLDRGFAHFSDYYREPLDGVARTTIGRYLAFSFLPRLGHGDMPGRRRAPEINAELLRWIDRRNGRPFFALVNYFDVHPPLVPPPSRRGRFSAGRPEEKATTNENCALTDEIALPSPEELQDRLNRYDESILAWDDSFGHLLRELDSRGLRENTLIIVTSDHGEGFGEHGLLSHGHSLYRDQIDIPLVLYWPARIKEPHRISEPAGLERLASTLLDAAGVDASAFPGRSLLVVDSAPGRVVVGVARRSLQSLGWPSSMGWVAGMMTRDWRFHLREDGTAELFDAVADPDERHNLVADTAHAGVADSLRRELDRIGVGPGLEGR